MPAAIREAVSRALKKAGISVNAVDIHLEHPATLIFGDYATSAAIKYSKEAGVSPTSLAPKIVSEIEMIAGLLKPTIAGPGFINISVRSEILTDAIEKARTEDMWGAGFLNKGKKIMIEYTDPNPFKEFHIGHLMSNAIGESVARLTEFT